MSELPYIAVHAPRASKVWRAGRKRKARHIVRLKVGAIGWQWCYMRGLFCRAYAPTVRELIAKVQTL